MAGKHPHLLAGQRTIDVVQFEVALELLAERLRVVEKVVC